MRPFLASVSLALVLTGVCSVRAADQKPGSPGMLHLHLRSRVETFKGSGKWDEVTVERDLPADQTAIVLCDVWDNHWCRGAASRCDEIAHRIEPVISAARKRGVLIVHSPSDCMDFYKDAPGRKRILESPKIAPPPPLVLNDPPLPIDDSDGGCDTGEKTYKAWSRQNAAITVDDADVVSDRGEEVYSYLKQKGIKNIIFMGVHTNMCVLNRTFAIKQMTRWGMRCILTRDLTDTMYDPKDRPHVSHEQGTELVVQHIEKNWGPSILSADLFAK